MGGTHSHQPVVSCNEKEEGGGKRQWSVGRQTHSLRSVATHPCPHAHEDPGEVAELGGPPHLYLDVGTASSSML